MATITQNITIDVARANVFDAVIGKQYDEDSRFLKCSITQEGEPLTIPSGSSIAINAKRPDGTMGSFAGTRGADGTAIVPISSWILEQNGMVNLSVSIVGSGGEKLTSCTFYLNVQEAEGEGYILVYTAPSSVATGTYYITLGGVSYQFDLTTALATGDKIYFSSTYAMGKTVDGSDGSTIETLTLTEGTSGTELVGSDVINFLASFMANIADLGNKADKVGESPDLVAGTAEQIIGEEFTENKVPYSFRQTPGSGKRLAEEVVGATVAWNQLIQKRNYANTATTDTRAYISFQIQVISPSTVVYSKSISTAGRLCVIFNSSAMGLFRLKHNGSQHDLEFYNSTSSNIILTAGHKYFVNLYFESIDVSTPSGVLVTDMQISDLTAALGPTIADYLYTLESNTPGAGVAKFRELFPADYYAYCEPTLQSVCVSEHREYGVNAWDEEYEAGGYDTTTGEKTPMTYRGRSKNYIRVLPSTSYFFKAPASVIVLFYDSNHTYLGNVTASANSIATTPANCSYITFFLGSSSNPQTTYNHNITINLSNPLINGKYYPYSVNSYPLEAVELRGVLKLDGSNNIYADGDTYEGDGTVTRRYGVVDLGSLTFSTNQTGTNTYEAACAPVGKANGVSNFICSKIAYAAYADDGQYGIRGYSSSGSVAVRVPISVASTPAAIKTAMSGVYLVYELATPTTETAAPYPSLQHCSGGGTEEYVDYLVGQGTRDVSIPAGHNSKYYPDLTQRISDIPEPPSGDGTYTLKCTVSSGVRTFAWA